MLGISFFVITGYGLLLFNQLVTAELLSPMPRAELFPHSNPFII
jgi:hypothetical protein